MVNAENSLNSSTYSQSYSQISKRYPQIVDNACFIYSHLLYFQSNFLIKGEIIRVFLRKIEHNVKKAKVLMMETNLWVVDKDVDKKKGYPQLAEAARLLANNEVVAFPTETVYGLGGNAKSDEAVKRIFEAKGRPNDNPLIVHVASMEQLNEITTEISELAKTLIKKFWPGPLTLILEKKEGALPNSVTAGLRTVGVRMPDHPVALEVIRMSGVPIAAPSANTSGKPSPTTAKHVSDDLNGRIAGIVDGGSTGVGVESTVLDCTVPVPVILRPGGVTKEELEAVIGPIKEDASLKNQAVTPKSPGMKYTHYAPDAPLILIDGKQGFFQQIIEQYQAVGKKVAVMVPEEHKHDYQADYLVCSGSLANLHSIAAKLYDTLRTFNDLDVDIILAEVYPEAGIGHAIMNRLLKAAGHQLIKEE